jgi:rare lipoprotein A
MKKCILTILFFAITPILFAQVLTGTASFYAPKFNGRKTATGEIFSNKGLTCACNQLKLGSIVQVTNLRNNKTIVLKINDRLSASNHRLVDLTEHAAKELGYYNTGLTKVKVEVINSKKKANKEDNYIKPQLDSIANTSVIDSIAK